jgi:hypothetical protein
MDGGTLRCGNRPQGTLRLRKQSIISNSSRNFRRLSSGHHPIVCKSKTPTHTRPPTSWVRRGTGGKARKLRAADVDDSDLVDLEESLESAEAQLERQFIEDTRSQGGGSLARGILSDADIEGNPLAFLKVSEAYWTVRRHLLLRHDSLPNPL